MQIKNAISASSKNLFSCSAKPETWEIIPNLSSSLGKISSLIFSETEAAFSGFSSDKSPVTLTNFCPSFLVIAVARSMAERRGGSLRAKEERKARFEAWYPSGRHGGARRWRRPSHSGGGRRGWSEGQVRVGWDEWVVWAFGLTAYSNYHNVWCNENEINTAVSGLQPNPPWMDQSTHSNFNKQQTIDSHIRMKTM